GPQLQARGQQDEIGSVKLSWPGKSANLGNEISTVRNLSKRRIILDPMHRSPAGNLKDPASATR
ncbi:MAG: hypothetical protein OXF26_11450, partial [Alphaproteobacteria bacterium]|nr:hypothetical protein [Alphaproteobacteria bacterium]